MDAKGAKAEKGAGTVVATVDEIPPGAAKVVEIGGRSIGILNVNGRYFALRNRCPHRGAPMCGYADGRSLIGGTLLTSGPHEYRYGMDDELIRCPWHGFEFRLEDGRSLVEPEQLRMKTYEVEVRGTEIVLHV
jgi:3-phenylpropionate/trans-cinnamate dioxygenase ferredoxin subunit